MTHMLTRRALIRSLALSTLVASTVRPALAQTYPSRPIRLLVGGAAGSVPDTLARLIADRLSPALGQPVLVENRVGAAGIIAIQGLVRSEPDGHTLALATMSQAVFNSYLFSSLPYDPLRDIEPVSPLVTGAMAVAAHPTLPANTLAEFVSLAKAQPGKLLVGTTGAGSPPHVFAQLLVRATGIEVMFVPFRSGPEGITGVMRGDVQVFFDAPTIIAPQVKAGTIKALAVTGRARDPELPSVPTVAEAGFREAQCEAWIGLVAPARTPAGIVARLNSELAAILAVPELRRRLEALSFEPIMGTPEEFRARIREEHARWGKLIKEVGIKLD
jgi:tripartite-type tricarboxylate transporter receptor subunit TctC